MKKIPLLAVGFLLFSIFHPPARAQNVQWVKAAQVKPKWIWLSGPGVAKQVWFRKSFVVPEGTSKAKLYATCDNELVLSLDGKVMGECPDWGFPVIKEIPLQPGKHTLAVAGKNHGGIAAFVLLLEYESGGKKHYVTSDKTWKISDKQEPGWEKPDFDDSGWSGEKITVLNSLGASPWGIPGQKGGGSSRGGGGPVKAENITTLPGFKVEHIYTVPKSEQGSWVSLTVDPKGRLYASDQGKAGLFQINVSESAKGPTASVSQVKVKYPDRNDFVSGAQGLQFAFGDLYFHRNGGHMYRLDDSDGDGEFDSAEVIPSQTGGGEHGNHDVIVSEDGSALYMIGGNHAPLGEHVRSAVTSWDEDLLLPRMWDARGHARGRMAPGGWVTRLDPEKKTQELISIGYRNQYGIALNKHGDMFTYDADMEWDLGSPWYRPTRICLVASGSDYGWRGGTGKWPTYFEDTLAPVVEIGPGCPTGVISGKGARFPEKYQEAIFALDWTFGTIYAIHLKEHGAGYIGQAEPFLFGAPLPVTDAVIGKDGSLYFLIGGRGTQSAMFRVSHDGKTQIAATPSDPEAAKARKLRRSLEAFHGVKNGEAVAAVWSHLSSEDRFLRHAARVAVESQPSAQWAEKLFADNDPQTVITGSVALARSGEKSFQTRLVDKLLSLDPGSLTEQQKLGMLRAFSLTFIRQGQPTAIQKAKVIAMIDPLLPSDSHDLNNELLKMLVYLRASTAVEKGMNLITNRGAPDIPDWSELISRNDRYGGTVRAMLDNHPPSREIGYALMLSNLDKGWTMDQRRDFFTFLNEAAKKSGGASYPGFLTNIRSQALGSCSNEERSALSDITGENFNPVPDFEIKGPQGPGQVWELEEAVGKGSRRGANFENGRSLFFAIGCGACHRHAGLGGGVGPDLTTIPTKFDDRYLLEAIINPSKDISDQYGSSVVTMKDGTIHTGLAVEKQGKLEIYIPDPKAPPTVVSSADVKSIEESPVSQMPPGMINVLNPDELRDLTAYLMSAGDPKNKRFKK